MLLGGYTKEGIAKFAKPTLQIPAKRVPEAVNKLLHYYLENHSSKEIFRDFVERVGTHKIKELLLEFTTIPAGDPKMYEDLGAEGTAFKMEMGKGECAA
jgi:ferredoxin-nitrite reductase/sulfite reductase (ferredoxin)